MFSYQYGVQHPKVIISEYILEPVGQGKGDLLKRYASITHKYTYASGHPQLVSNFQFQVMRPRRDLKDRKYCFV